MKWSDDLSVGVETIDDQHKELFEKIGFLLQAIKSKTCKYKIGDVMKFLEEYVVYHFGEEEKFMRQFDYPEYRHHRQQHDEFWENIREIKKMIPGLEGGKKPGSYDVSVQTNQLVVDWILEHIAKKDKKLGAYLKNKL